MDLLEVVKDRNFIMAKLQKSLVKSDIFEVIIYKEDRNWLCFLEDKSTKHDLKNTVKI